MEVSFLSTEDREKKGALRRLDDVENWSNSLLEKLNKKFCLLEEEIRELKEQLRDEKQGRERDVSELKEKLSEQFESEKKEEKAEKQMKELRTQISLLSEENKKQKVEIVDLEKRTKEAEQVCLYLKIREKAVAFYKLSEEKRKALIRVNLRQKIENFFESHPILYRWEKLVEDIFKDAGKITSMLFQSLDERQLIKLTENPDELSNRIEESIGALQKARIMQLEKLVKHPFFDVNFNEKFFSFSENNQRVTCLSGKGFARIDYLFTKKFSVNLQVSFLSGGAWFGVVSRNVDRNSFPGNTSEGWLIGTGGRLFHNKIKVESFQEMACEAGEEVSLTCDPSSSLLLVTNKKGTHTCKVQIPKEVFFVVALTDVNASAKLISLTV